MTNETIATPEQDSKPADGKSALNDGLERPRYERRLGRFALSRMMIERDQETARAIMGRCIIVRCEMMYESNKLEYLALSPAFDELQQGMMAPTYEVHISDGGALIEFKRSNAEITGSACGVRVD